MKICYIKQEKRFDNRFFFVYLYSMDKQLTIQEIKSIIINRSYKADGYVMISNSGSDILETDIDFLLVDGKIISISSESDYSFNDDIFLERKEYVKIRYEIFDKSNNFTGYKFIISLEANLISGRRLVYTNPFTLVEEGEHIGMKLNLSKIKVDLSFTDCDLVW